MTSISSFNQETKAHEVVSAFPEAAKGKTILITGVGPNGLGEETAKSLALQNPALLILTGRSLSKVKAVQAQLPSHVSTRLVKLDLSSFASIRTAVQEITSHVQHINILINNAGVMKIPERHMSEDGFEMQLAVNYLGPYMLTTCLLDRGLIAGGSRIVNVGSNGYLLSPFRFADYNFEGKDLPEAEMPNKRLCEMFKLPWSTGYTPTTAYGHSKTALLLFTVQLQRLYGDKDITALCLHPGEIVTELWRYMSKEDSEKMFAMINSVSRMKSPSQGASTTLVAALDPKLNNSSGLYMADCQITTVQDHAKDPSIAEKLWDLSKALTAGTGEMA